MHRIARQERLDKFWADQNVMFDWTADITGTGDLSEYIVEVISKSRRSCGKTTESGHPQNFQHGLVIWHTKKGRKIFWGLACGKRGIVLFGVKSIECCKKS